MKQKLLLTMLFISSILGFTAKAQNWKGSEPKDQEKFFFYNVGTGKYIGTQGRSTKAFLQDGSGLEFTLEQTSLFDYGGGFNGFASATSLRNGLNVCNELCIQTDYDDQNEPTTPYVCISGGASFWVLPIGRKTPDQVNRIAFLSVDGLDNTYYIVLYEGISVYNTKELHMNGSRYIYAGEDGKTIAYSKEKPTSLGSRAYWKLVSKGEIMDAMRAKTFMDGEPLDVSLLIPGRSFHYRDNETDMWTTTHKGGNWDLATSTNGYCGNEAWNNTFDVQQTIKNLPNGVYEVRCSGFGTNGTTYLYANEKDVALMSDNSTPRGTDKVAKWAAIAEDNAFAENATDTFTVLNHKITLGVRRDVNQNQDWAVYDEFRLYFHQFLNYEYINDIESLEERLDTLLVEAKSFNKDELYSVVYDSLQSTIERIEQQEYQTVEEYNEVVKFLAQTIEITKTQREAYINYHPQFLKVRDDMMRLLEQQSAYTVLPGVNVTDSLEKYLDEVVKVFAGTDMEKCANVANDAKQVLGKFFQLIDVLPGRYIDLTEFLLPGADLREPGSIDYWTMQKNTFPEGNPIQNGKATLFYYNDRNSCGFDFYQQLSFLPAGRYGLQVESATDDWVRTTDKNKYNAHTYLYAGNQVMECGHFPPNITVSYTRDRVVDLAIEYIFNKGKCLNKMELLLEEDAKDIKIGMRNEDLKPETFYGRTNIIVMRNMQLLYYGSDLYVGVRMDFEQALALAQAVLSDPAYASYTGEARAELEKGVNESYAKAVVEADEEREKYVAATQALKELTQAFKNEASSYVGGLAAARAAYENACNKALEALDVVENMDDEVGTDERIALEKALFTTYSIEVVSTNASIQKYNEAAQVLTTLTQSLLNEVYYYQEVTMAAYACDLQEVIDELNEMNPLSVPSTYYENIQDAIKEYGKDYNTVEEYVSAISTLQAMLYEIPEIQRLYALYAETFLAVSKLETMAKQGFYTCDEKDINEFKEIFDTAKKHVVNVELESAIASLQYAASKLAGAVQFTEGQTMDLTHALILDADLRQTGSIQTWTIERNTNPNYPKCNERCTEFWDANFDFSQTLSNLPAGRYRLELTAFHRAANAGSTYHTYLYAGDRQVLITPLTQGENDMTAASNSFDKGMYVNSLDFTLYDMADVKIGLRNDDTDADLRENGSKTDKWTIFRDFKLYYYGVEPIRMDTADIQLTHLSVGQRYYKSKTDEMVFTVSMANSGKEMIPNPQIAVSIDGNDIGVGTINATVSDKEISSRFSLALNSFELGVGKHTLKVGVYAFNGGMPLTEGTTDDDWATQTFYIYQNSMQRDQTLMEFYTQRFDQYSPEQIYVMEEMMKGRTDIAPVFIHGNYFGDDYPDPLSIDEANYLAACCGLEDCGTVVFNRTVVPGHSSMGGYLKMDKGEELSNFIDGLTAITPNFARVTEIKPTLSKDFKTLSLQVACQRNADFRTLFGNGSLTVYLTEDKVSGTQFFPYNEELMEEKSYQHNHVLRKVVNVHPMGDEIAWPNNGLTYTKTFNVDVEKGWNLENMNVVAAIGRVWKAGTPIDNLDVTNANSISLKGLKKATGVEEIEGAENQNETDGYYTLDGRRLSEKPKERGIYIIDRKKTMVK